MPVGDLIYTPSYLMVKLLEGANAATGAPVGGASFATTGVVFPSPTNPGFSGPSGYVNRASVVIKSTAGTGAVGGTFRAWVGSAHLADAGAGGAAGGCWFPASIGDPPSAKGMLNNGANIGPTVTNAATHSEPIYYIGHFDRFNLEVVTVTGTLPAFDAWLVVPLTAES